MEGGLVKVVPKEVVPMETVTEEAVLGRCVI